jgi:hypothetical protein
VIAKIVLSLFMLDWQHLLLACFGKKKFLNYCEFREFQITYENFWLQITAEKQANPSTSPKVKFLEGICFGTES